MLEEKESELLSYTTSRSLDCHLKSKKVWDLPHPYYEFRESETKAVQKPLTDNSLSSFSAVLAPEFLCRRDLEK